MSKKIIVAEDDKSIITLMTAALGSNGYEVIAVENGRDVFDECVRVQPGLLLLDVMLPGKDGFSIALQMNKDERTRKIPIIVLSAKPAMRELFSMNEDAKIWGFMDKPFDYKKLIEMVRETCGA